MGQLMLHELFLIGILSFFAGSFFSLFVKENLKTKILLLFNLAGTCFIASACYFIFTGSALEIAIYAVEPFGVIWIRIDSLSAFFIAVISLVSLINLIFTDGYIKAYLKKGYDLSAHFFFFNLLIISMILVFCVQNALVFLICWEMMSLSSFFLITLENEKREVIRSGIYYLIAMHLGIIFLMTGFIFLILETKSLDFFVFQQYLSLSSFRPEIFFLLFFGFGVKAGFFPFYTWLPKAHSNAPSHISALMSGLMIKTGIYGILRLFLWNAGIPQTVLFFLLFLALFTALWAIILAVTQKDFKKILAYSSIENIGIIGIGIGVGLIGIHFKNEIMAVLGFSGALLHLLNHAFFKSLLFFGAGVVYQQTHTRNIDQLGGIAKKLPFLSVLVFMGVMSISALPGLNGFIGEFLIYLGLLNGLKVNSLLSLTGILSIGVFSLIGIIVLFCFVRFFGIAFLGNPRSERHFHRPEKSIFLSMILLGIPILLIGLFPQFIWPFIYQITQNFASLSGGKFILIQQNLENLSGILIGFYLSVGALLGLRYLLLRNRKTETRNTWGCGYQYPSSKIQYTGFSFAMFFREIVKPLFQQRRKKPEMNELFPSKKVFLIAFRDKMESYLIEPLLNNLLKFLSFFGWIQNGAMQRYISYILVFLLISVIWVMASK